MDKTEKPDNIVAEEIVNKLLAEKLLSKDKKEEWIRKLSLGNVSQEDWNFLAEVYTQKQIKK